MSVCSLLSCHILGRHSRRQRTGPPRAQHLLRRVLLLLCQCLCVCVCVHVLHRLLRLIRLLHSIRSDGRSYWLRLLLLLLLLLLLRVLAQVPVINPIIRDAFPCGSASKPVKDTTL